MSPSLDELAGLRSIHNGLGQQVLKQTLVAPFSLCLRGEAYEVWDQKIQLL